MNTYVALLRGINVGGRNALPMSELKQSLESVGCKEIQTHIQSGNVVLRSSTKPAMLARDIASAIKTHHGFEPHVLVMDKVDFEEAVRNNPFPEAESEPKSVHLGFLDAVPSVPDLEGLDGIRAASERFKLKGRVFYLHAPDGIGRSKLAANSEKLLGVPMTDRNWRTVSKLMEMLER
jgi:uncharacterized protein (DUF1697 family)